MFPKWRTVLFVNGCFWHQHSGCRRGAPPKSNVEFWGPKLARNVERDHDAYERLMQSGWRVAVLWECETKTPAAIEDALKRIFAGPPDWVREV